MWSRNARFGPTTSTPERSSWARKEYSSHAARCRPTAVLPVPGAPCTQMLVARSLRTISSCSGWIVETMSRIGPERGRSISAARMALWSVAVARG